MRAVGEILKETREAKKIDLGEVEKATKIKVRLLQALEKNEFAKFTDATIVKGFIKNYAEFLGLSSRDLLAIFRRDFIEDKKGQILPRGVYEPLSLPRLAWTPKLTLGVSVGILISIFTAYLVIQLVQLLGAPPLEIFSPQNGERSTAGEVLIKGKTIGDAVIQMNREIVLVSSDGLFEKKVNLLPGENKITIEAISRRGKKTIKEIRIYY